MGRWWCSEKRSLVLEYAPYVLMTLCYLCLAVLMVLLQTLMTSGVNSLVFVFYEHFVSTLLLSSLSFFFERGKTPAFTFNLFCWTFFLGFLEIPLCQLLLTSSLQYVSASTQGTVLNTVPAVTFVIAIIFRQETFEFCTINGQSKLWGILSSAFGATMMVLWTGPKLGAFEPSSEFSISREQVIGSFMILGSVFAAASWNTLVERLAMKYHSKIFLAAMMSFWGSLQTGIIAGFTERNASTWAISFHKSYELLVILYGGIIVTGLTFYAQTWCIHKKGPVFASAFSPLLIVFSFLLESVFLRKAVHLGSILGAIVVIMGLYLLLWSKAYDNERKKEGNLRSDDQAEENLSSPLLV